MCNECGRVHIIHWRAQYQLDRDKGARSISDIYPNLAVDMYPYLLPSWGNIRPLSEEQVRAFRAAQAAGNPKAFPKKSGVAEMVAEGFGTGTPIASNGSVSDARWEDGRWTVVVSRPLSSDDASVLRIDTENQVAFAVWQGGAGEVGSRKSVTMSWAPLLLE
jgi:hypothetical protein